MVLTADLSERPAEYVEDSANSSDSEVHFVAAAFNRHKMMLLMMLLLLRMDPFAPKRIASLIAHVVIVVSVAVTFGP